MKQQHSHNDGKNLPGHINGKSRRLGLWGEIIAFIAALVLVTATRGWADGKFDLEQTSKPAEAEMCIKQKPLTEKELTKALAVMKDIRELGGNLKPEDEETLVRGHGLTSDRMNCLLGKLMAGNDIFGWGVPAAYGINLTAEELEITKKYAGESRTLKKYLEESLNIKIE